MKRLAAVIVAVVCLVPSGVRAQNTAWFGEFVVTAVNGSCTSVGHYQSSLFLPKNLGTNPASTYFTTSSLFGAYSHHWVGDPDASGDVDYNGSAIGLFGTPFTWLGKFKNLTIKPALASITAATMYVRISGKLKKYRGSAGCTVTFRSHFRKRI